MAPLRTAITMYIWNIAVEGKNSSAEAGVVCAKAKVKNISINHSFGIDVHNRENLYIKYEQGSYMTCNLTARVEIDIQLDGLTNGWKIGLFISNSAEVTISFKILFVLRFYGPINTIKVLSSWTVYLSTLLLGRFRPKQLTST